MIPGRLSIFRPLVLSALGSAAIPAVFPLRSRLCSRPADRDLLFTSDDAPCAPQSDSYGCGALFIGRTAPCAPLCRNFVGRASGVEVFRSDARRSGAGPAAGRRASLGRLLERVPGKTPRPNERRAAGGRSDVFLALRHNKRPTGCVCPAKTRMCL